MEAIGVPGAGLADRHFVDGDSAKHCNGLPVACAVQPGEISGHDDFPFLLLSQVMVNAGFLVEAQRTLQSLSGISLAPTIALLAGIAGYVTGSNVGGNTLVMPSIAALTTEHGAWLAAMVNSAAGHGALGSLSILSLITGLAGANRLEEHNLIRFAFGLVALNIVIVAATGAFYSTFSELFRDTTENSWTGLICRTSAGG
ncbi:hypothetical protein PYV50_25005 [Pseudomonas sp. H22_DOA]|nr:hypothetical protein PYV50_25005 [Pseudomonas sp. H22_DOA]